MLDTLTRIGSSTTLRR